MGEQNSALSTFWWILGAMFLVLSVGVVFLHLARAPGTIERS